MSGDDLPKIRRLQISAGQWENRPVVVLQDPLGLTDQAVAVPKEVAPLIELCDGSRNIATLRTAFELRTGLKLGPDYVEKMLTQLDEALLLENERFLQAHRETVERFRAAPFRPPKMAGKVYPSTVEWLDRNFREYFEAVASDGADVDVVGSVRGLVSPHIDYQRGGAIYAKVWQQAAEAAKEAEVAVVLGTNHHDCQKLITMTRQSYSTPWGVMPTASDVVDEVEADLGDKEVFAEELHHRTEHSVEAAAVWLHYFVKDTSCKMVPVLCGSFHEFTHGNALPDNDERLHKFVEAVRRSTADRRTLIVAAADLAHAGPAFGDPYPIDVTHRASMSAADTELMDCIARGDAEGTFSKVKAEGDRRRICGLAPIYLALRILGESTGRVTGYEHCPADQQGTSFVSICGMVLS